MQFRKIGSRLQSVSLLAILRCPSEPSVASVLGLMLTLAAVLAAALGAWRLGADPGWTNDFFITDGWLSRYQSWFAVAIGAQGAAVAINRRVAIRNMDQLAGAR